MITGLESFTTEQIRRALVTGSGSYWKVLSDEEKAERLNSNILGSQSRKKSRESLNQYYANMTTEERLSRNRHTSEGTQSYFDNLDEAGYAELCSRNQKRFDDMSYEEKEEYRELHREFSQRFYDSPEGVEAKKCLSELARDNWASKTEEEKKEWLDKSCHSKEARAKVKAGASISEGLLRYWSVVTDEERKARLESWLASDAILNTVKGNHKRPTQPESMLEYFLNKNFTGEWAYNGDGSQNVRIGRCVPDFVSLVGWKAVIEVFGGYWHQFGDEEAKIAHYKELAYSCLVLWDYECYLEGLVVDKIRAFSKSKASELLEENTSEPSKLLKEVINPL